MEEKVWEAVRELLLNPGVLWEGFAAREAELMEQKARLTEHLEAMLKLKERAEQKLEALTDAYLDPEIRMSKWEYARQRRRIEEEIEAWQHEAAEARKRLEQKAITKEQMEAVEEFAAKVSKGIDRLSFEEKRKILQMLEVRGTVHHDDEVWVELEGLFPAVGVGIMATPS